MWYKLFYFSREFGLFQNYHHHMSSSGKHGKLGWISKSQWGEVLQNWAGSISSSLTLKFLSLLLLLVSVNTARITFPIVSHHFRSGNIKSNNTFLNIEAIGTDFFQAPGKICDSYVIFLEKTLIYRFFFFLFYSELDSFKLKSYHELKHQVQVWSEFRLVSLEVLGKPWLCTYLQ